MAREAYEKALYFRGNQIHDDIIKAYQKAHPQYTTKADVLRHAIVLLDEDMRKKNGQDESSELIGKVDNLEASIYEIYVQNELLIKVSTEILTRINGARNEKVSEERIKVAYELMNEALKVLMLSVAEENDEGVM